jgi:hypothetical protein
MAEEQGSFAFGDVVAAISDKMIRRHPHVFAGESVENAQAQTVAWEQQKRRERESAGHEDTSALAGIARGLPEWQRAVKLQKRAASVGFDWPDITPVIAKLHEEIEEVRTEFSAIAADPDDFAARDRLAKRSVGRESDWVENHPALGSLHTIDFGGLPVDRHVLVDDADPAVPGHRHRHVGLGNRVHRSRGERQVEGDPAREQRDRIYIFRVDQRMPRSQQDIVEGQDHVGSDARKSLVRLT